MKFTIALSALASLASITSVFAESIYFVATSIDGKHEFPIASHHQVEGTDYFFESDVGEVFELNNGLATKKYGSSTGYVGIGPDHHFAVGPAVSPEILNFEYNTISNLNFLACKDYNGADDFPKDKYYIRAYKTSSVEQDITACFVINVSKRAASDSTSA